MLKPYTAITCLILIGLFNLKNIVNMYIYMGTPVKVSLRCIDMSNIKTEIIIYKLSVFS